MSIDWLPREETRSFPDHVYTEPCWTITVKGHLWDRSQDLEHLYAAFCPLQRKAAEYLPKVISNFRGHTKSKLLYCEEFCTGQLSPSKPIICIFTARKRSLRRLWFHRCLSVHRGGVVCPIDCWDAPPGRYTHLSRYTPGRYISQCMLEYIPCAGTSLPDRYTTCSGRPPGMISPGKVHPQACIPPGRYTPQ